MSKRVAITTLGCKTNQFESAGMSESLQQQGYQAVPFNEQADVYIINTCTVTAKSDAESRKLIRRAARLNPAAQVVVTGCYAQLAADELSRLPNVSLVIGNSEKRDIARLLETAVQEGGASVSVADISGESTAEPLQLESFAEHTRAFLQIQNGCDAYCAYCIVPYARGRSRSVPFDEVLAGVKRFADAGFREVVLTGIHLGAYGRDLPDKVDLAALLNEVGASGAVNRLRVGSVEPDEVTDVLIDIMASGRHICPHLHLPLQSGPDSVLTSMGRGYRASDLRSLVNLLVASMPDISIGFDVIAGFPGESEEDHAVTCKLLQELPVAYLHVFPYSSRPGTRAAEMPGHLSPQVIKRRAEELRRIGEEKKLAFASRFVGKELELVMLEGGKRGISGNYLTVSLAKSHDAPVARVKVLSVTADGGCIGELLHDKPL